MPQNILLSLVRGMKKNYYKSFFQWRLTCNKELQLGSLVTNCLSVVLLTNEIFSNNNRKVLQLNMLEENL